MHIVARNQQRLDDALKLVEVCARFLTCVWARTPNRLQAERQSPEQMFKTYSFALDNAKEAEACLDAVSATNDGRCADALFLCAGKSRPGFRIECTEEEFWECMQ